MFVFADKLAVLVGIPDATLGITAIAPAVFFVAMTSAYRGYFQGRQNMYPTAISEVTECLGKLIFGYLFAWMFMRHSVEKASAGAVFGVTMGTVLGFFTLLAMYMFYRKKREPYAPGEVTDSYKNILEFLIKIF